MLPPPADTVSTSTRGIAIGTSATLPPGSTSASPSRMSPTSALVPPMSIVSARATPSSRAIAAAPTTPPAGPERARLAALLGAASMDSMPPLDVMTPIVFGRSVGRLVSRYCRFLRYRATPGRRYASATVVAARSYSLISGKMSDERMTSTVGRRS